MVINIESHRLRLIPFGDFLIMYARLELGVKKVNGLPVSSLRFVSQLVGHGE
jgi:hypothetical protein